MIKEVRTIKAAKNLFQALFSGGSPISKHDSSAGECDSDEKNPDIIPQPVDADEVTEYARKHQHVSTIETSPSQSLLHHAPTTGTGGYIGYCTLRNGMPVHEIPTQPKVCFFICMKMYRFSVSTLLYCTINFCKQ